MHTMLLKLSQNQRLRLYLEATLFQLLRLLEAHSARMSAQHGFVRLHAGGGFIFKPVSFGHRMLSRVNIARLTTGLNQTMGRHKLTTNGLACRFPHRETLPVHRVKSSRGKGCW